MKNKIKPVIGIILFSLISTSMFLIDKYSSNFTIRLIWLALFVDLCAVTVYLLFVFNVKNNSRISKYINYLNKYHCAFITESMLFAIALLLLLPVINGLQYENTINCFLLSGTVLIGSLFLWFVINLILFFSTEPAALFAVIAIPCCMAYCLLIVPNAVPDEAFHFGKSYLTSLGVFSNEYEFSLPSQYSEFETNYYQYSLLIKYLFSKTNYNDLIVRGTLLQSNFIIYLIPAFGIWLGRTLDFSLMVCYILGRMFNAFFYIYMGYWAIKKIPLGKYVLFLYMLNPVCVQQASSTSSDALLMALSFYSIGHLLDLALNEKEIQYGDILILGCMMVVVTLIKPNYFLIYGLVILCWKQLIKMGWKKWILVCCMVLFVPLAYYGNTLLNVTDNFVTSLEVYEADAGVNVNQQISYLLQQPTDFIIILKNTLEIQWRFLLDSYDGALLSWFNIALPNRLVLLYQVLIIISAFISTNKKKISWSGKALCLLLWAAMIFSIFLAMYLYWSPVKSDSILGVQGRYFIPFMIIGLLILIPKNNREFKYIGILYSLSAAIFHLVAVYIIFMQFV